MKCISITDPFRVKDKEPHSFIELYDERTKKSLDVASRLKKVIFHVDVLLQFFYLKTLLLENANNCFVRLFVLFLDARDLYNRNQP